MTTTSAWADRSEQIDAISASLVRALGEMVDIPKTQTANVGKYKYNFATLADTLQMARPILSKHDLAVTQTAESNQSEIIVWTSALHSSGQFVTSQPLRLPAGGTAQETGSALSYARRYALMAFLGLATDDDDGASASPRTERSNAPVVRSEARPVPEARTEQEAEIRRRLAQIPAAVAATIKTAFMAEFGCTLTDLEPTLHVAALALVLEQIEQAEEAE
jgi:hypothetical protein